MRRFVLLLSALLLAAGCGRSPTIRPVGAQSVVLAFGDSLTSGVGAEPDESYPAVLGGLLGCRVVNAGIPGETSAEALARLPETLAATPADLVIVCTGGNDILRRTDNETIARNLDALVVAVRAAGADVLVVGVPRPGLRLKTPGFYREVARRHGVPCEDRSLAKILASPASKSDAIHPNAVGYRGMAEAVAAVIRDAQAR